MKKNDKRITIGISIALVLVLGLIVWDANTRANPPSSIQTTIDVPSVATTGNTYISNGNESVYTSPKREESIFGGHPKVTIDGWNQDGKYVYVDGTIENNSDESFEYIKVKAVYEDLSGDVLTTDWTYAVDSVEIKPGEKVQFDLMTKVTGDVHKVRLSIIDYDYS